MAMTDKELAAALLKLAKERFGDGPDSPHETNEQYLFGLLCDSVKVYSGDLDDLDEPDSLDATSDVEIAFTLGAVVANICPGWIVTDDSAVHS